MPTLGQKGGLYRPIEGHCGLTECPLRTKEGPLNKKGLLGASQGLLRPTQSLRNTGPLDRVISGIQKALSDQFSIRTGRQVALSGQRESFPGRQNNLLGPLKPIQDLHRIGRIGKGPSQSSTGPLTPTDCSLGRIRGQMRLLMRIIRALSS